MVALPVYRRLLLTFLACCALAATGGCTGRCLMIDKSGDHIFTWGPVRYAPEPRQKHHHQIVGVSMIPSDVIAPVGAEVVIVAAVRGTDGYLHANQRVEWTLSPGSVGQFVGLGRRTPLDWLVGFNNWPRKISPTYAVGTTSSRYLSLHRDTPTNGDDVRVERGQAWISVSSPLEGTSYVSAYAPEVARWDTHQRTATIHWIDAEIAYPPPAVNTAGSRHTFTTIVTRHTTHAPLAGWIVRYEITGGGPPAGFTPDGAQVVETVTNAAGQASIEIEQTAAAPGTNNVVIQVIHPSVVSPNGQRLVVGNGGTTKTWSSPDISIRKAGPAQASVGDTLTYRIEVRNPGSLMSREVTVTDQIVEGLSYLGSTPQASVTAGLLEWRLGDLAPGQARTIDVQLRADKPGAVKNCANVTTADRLSAQDCAPTTILSRTLNIALTGPTQAVVGQEVTFEARVTNRGGTALKALTMVDKYDVGFDHASRVANGARVIESDLGDLGPGESGRVDVTFRVLQPGNLCHTIEVQNASGTLASANACLTAVAPGAQVAPVGGPPKLSVTKTGPARQEVGQQVSFAIVVANVGQTPATNVKVVDHYDPAFRPLKSTAGSTWNEQTDELTWVVDRLAAGKSLTFQVLCNCQEPSANSCNQATVTSREGGSAQGEACVEIRAPNGLAVLVSEDPDPVAVGNQTAYLVRVTNYAKTADEDLAVAVTLPDGLTPLQVGTKGPSKYQVDGQTVRFDPVTEIAPNDTLSFTVVGTAERAGNVSCQVEVSSRKLDKPIVVDETTTVE